MFERSRFGQQNRSLFLGCDVVLYVEGRGRGSSGANGYDFLFWKRMFEAVRPELRLEIIQKGSKTNVLAILSDWGHNPPQGVYCAVDSDYDVLRGEMLAHPQLLFTYGYSFENDILFSDNIVETFFANCPVDYASCNVDELVSGWYSQLDRIGRRLARCDAATTKNGWAVIDREKFQRYLSRVADRDVRFRIDQVRYSIKNANRKPRPPLVVNYRNDICGRRHLLGHLIFEFAYRVYLALLARFWSSTNFSRDVLTSVAITSLFSLIRSGSTHPVAHHYRNMLATVNS